MLADSNSTRNWCVYCVALRPCDNVPGPSTVFECSYRARSIYTSCGLCHDLCCQSNAAQQCFQPAIPFEQLRHTDNDPVRLPNGRQAIVTSYQFQCCGDITAWQTYVEPGGARHQDGAYTIHFQVWRPSPTVGSHGAGCYSLVGENRFISITLINRAVSETPEPTNIISVQPGDVVGYYVLSSEEDVRYGDGIQMNSDDDSINIYYNEDNGGNPISLGPDSCQVRGGDGGLLTSSTSAAPQLSIDISKCLFIIIYVHNGVIPALCVV